MANGWDSRRGKAAKGQAAARHNKRKRDMDEAEQRNGQDRTRQTHEEDVGRHTVDGDTAADEDGSEPQAAAHTTARAHLAKSRGTNERTDGDDGQRRKARRENDAGNATTHETAQPDDGTRTEPSDAARLPLISYHSCKLSNNMSDRASVTERAEECMTEGAEKEQHGETREHTNGIESATEEEARPRQGRKTRRSSPFGGRTAPLPEGPHPPLPPISGTSVDG